MSRCAISHGASAASALGDRVRHEDCIGIAPEVSMIDVADCLYAIGCCKDSIEAVRAWSRGQRAENRTASKLLKAVREGGLQPPDEGSFMSPHYAQSWLTRWLFGWSHTIDIETMDVATLRTKLAKRIEAMAQLDPLPYPSDAHAMHDHGISKERIAKARELVPQLQQAGLL